MLTVARPGLAVPATASQLWRRLANLRWPGPDSSLMTSRRPAMVISSASAGPRTSAPAPAEKPRSVATSRTPRIRQSPPMSGAINAVRSAGSSRSGGSHAVVRAGAGCPGDELAPRRVRPCRPASPAAPGLQVICQQCQPLPGGARVVSHQGGGVDLIRPEPAADHACQQAARVQLVVADHVSNHIPYPPSRAQCRRLPLLRR